MDTKKIVEYFFLVALIALILVGIIGDFWTTATESLGFDDKDTRMGLWNICEKAVGDAPSVCTKQPENQPDYDTLQAIRVLVCMGSALFVFGYMAYLITEKPLVAGGMAILGSIMIFTGVGIWKYNYAPKIASKGYNGACFNIMISVGVLGLAYGGYQIYSHYKL